VGLCCRVATGSSDATLERKLAERWSVMFRSGGSGEEWQILELPSHLQCLPGAHRNRAGGGPYLNMPTIHPLDRATIGLGCRYLSW
jgi:hypothetical protein